MGFIFPPPGGAGGGSGDPGGQWQGVACSRFVTARLLSSMPPCECLHLKLNTSKNGLFLFPSKKGWEMCGPPPSHSPRNSRPKSTFWRLPNDPAALVFLSILLLLISFLKNVFSLLFPFYRLSPGPIQCIILEHAVRPLYTLTAGICLISRLASRSRSCLSYL